MLIHMRSTRAIRACMRLIEVRLVWSERERNVKVALILSAVVLLAAVDRFCMGASLATIQGVR